MSKGLHLRCDSCRATLSLPAPSGTWQRLSIRDRDGKLVIRHWCGQCNNTELWKRMEQL